MTADLPLIRVKNLKTYFHTDDGVAKAVDDVSFEVYRGETLGIVGESGCGKSVSSLSIMRLIPDPPGYFAGGEIWFRDRNILQLPGSEMRSIRGNAIGMIFQEPMTSLNPVYTCGNQIMEAIQIHQKVDRRTARQKAIKMLDLVGIPDPVNRIDDYPHQLSGGMRQRVMIAIALSCNPELLIADEPTTALDVTVQAQILDLIKNLQTELGMAVMMITHDLGVIAEVADRVIVMYAGQIVEEGPVDEIFHNPQHPYTIGLLKSVPNPEVEVERLPTIEGVVPNATDFPPACRFHPRCQRVMDICRTANPDLERFSKTEGRLVRCWDVETLATHAVAE